MGHVFEMMNKLYLYKPLLWSTDKVVFRKLMNHTSKTHQSEFFHLTRPQFWATLYAAMSTYLELRIYTMVAFFFYSGLIASTVPL